MVPEPRIVVAVSGWTSGEHGGALWPVVRAAPVCTGLSVVEGWPRLRELGTAWAWQWAHVFDCVGADGGAYWLWYFHERTSVIMGIVYIGGVGVWSPCVCIFNIIIPDVGTWTWQRAAALSEWAWQWAHVLGSVGPEWLCCFPERTSVIMGIVYVWGGGVWSPCVYFPYYYPRHGYMDLTACSSSQWVGVAVSPRAW